MIIGSGTEAGEGAFPGEAGAGHRGDAAVQLVHRARAGAGLVPHGAAAGGGAGAADGEGFSGGDLNTGSNAHRTGVWLF